MEIKTLQPSDVGESYVNWLNNPKINQFLEARFESHDIKGVKRFVENCLGSPRTFLLGVFLNEKVHIGNIKLEINPHHSRAEIGILLGDPSSWGKNLATEALISTTEYFAKTFKIRKFSAGMYEDNKGSLKAFLRAGFKKCGHLEQHVLVAGTPKDCLLVEKVF